MFIRKSIKLGKHTHINVTKNGVSSVTFGDKHARLGMRKDGSTYASGNYKGMYARQELTGRNTGKRNKGQKGFFDSLIRFQETKYSLKEARYEAKLNREKLTNPVWMINWLIINIVGFVVSIFVPALFILSAPSLLGWIITFSIYKYRNKKIKSKL